MKGHEFITADRFLRQAAQNGKWYEEVAYS